MKGLAVQLYTLRARLDTDLEATLAALAEAGARHVELAGLYGRSGAEMRAALDAAGLSAVAAHVAIGRFEGEPETVLEEASELELDTLIVPSLPRPETAAEADAAVERLRTAARIVEGTGLGFAYHNHDFEFRTLDDGTDFWSRIVAAGLSHELDAGWLHAAGQHPVTMIRQLSGRVPLVHAKDMRREGDGWIDVPAGDGELDFPAIAEAATEAGTDWLVVEMDNPSDDAIDDVRRSIKTLQAAL